MGLCLLSPKKDFHSETQFQPSPGNVAAGEASLCPHPLPATWLLCRLPWGKLRGGTRGGRKQDWGLRSAVSGGLGMWFQAAVGQGPSGQDGGRETHSELRSGGCDFRVVDDRPAGLRRSPPEPPTPQGGSDSGPQDADADTSWHFCTLLRRGAGTCAKHARPSGDRSVSALSARRRVAERALSSASAERPGRLPACSTATVDGHGRGGGLRPSSRGSAAFRAFPCAVTLDRCRVGPAAADVRVSSQLLSRPLWEKMRTFL